MIFAKSKYIFLILFNASCISMNENSEIGSEHFIKNGIYYQKDLVENFIFDKNALYFWPSIEINDNYLITNNYLCSKLIETQYFYINDKNIVPENYDKNHNFKFLSDTVKSVAINDQNDSITLNIVYADEFKLYDKLVFSIQDICIEKLSKNNCEFEILYC